MGWVNPSWTPRLLRPLFDFCWLWIFSSIKLSWHSCSMWDKPGWLNWFWQFLCEELSSINLRGFYYSYAWSHSLCEGRTSFCIGLISKKLYRSDSYLCFQLALLYSVSYFFLLYQSPSSCLCTVFDTISSNINEVLSINPSGNVFVFGHLNVHYKDWQTFSGGTDELCYNFSISNDLT